MNINEHEVRAAVDTDKSLEINAIKRCVGGVGGAWLLVHTCVCADVSSQQPRPGEGLPAGWAHAGQGV